MNKIILCGRLTRDPEVRYVNDNKIGRYTLAVDRRFKREGEPDADFFNCTVFGKSAEFAENYFKQGTKLIIVGRIESDNYTNKDGEKVYGWRVVVDEQEFAESKKAAEENGQAPAKKPGKVKTDKDGFIDIAEGITEDLPFI